MRQYMPLIFFFLFYLLSELTYQVAIYQSQGLVRHISAADLCWLNRLILVIPTTRLLGVGIGIVFTLATLFTFTHITLGWIFTLPSLFTKDPDKVLNHIEFDCAMLPFANIAAIILSIISFFVPYKSVANSLSPYWLHFAGISVLGFFVRMTVAYVLQNKSY